MFSQYIVIYIAIWLSYFIPIYFSFSIRLKPGLNCFSWRNQKDVLNDSLDITPNRDGGVMKRVLRRGNGAQGYPLNKDTVEIAWKLFLSNGSLAHSSDELEEEFDFVVNAEPRQVILAWEHAVKTMFEGELAQLIIKPEYGFGVNGAPPIIPPNALLTCEFELRSISPSIVRQYDLVGYNESIRDDLMDKIQSGVSSISSNVMDNKPIAEITSDKQRKFFDPARHKVDPKLRVTGEGEKWLWEETSSQIEIQFKLPHNVKNKDDLNIDLKANDVCVRVKATAEVVIEGPWHGKINPSESTWALSDDEYSSWHRGPRLVLSLQKAYGQQDIWASVLRDPDIMQDSDNDSSINSNYSE